MPPGTRVVLSPVALGWEPLLWGILSVKPSLPLGPLLKDKFKSNKPTGCTGEQSGEVQLTDLLRSGIPLLAICCKAPHPHQALQRKSSREQPPTQRTAGPQEETRASRKQVGAYCKCHVAPNWPICSLVDSLRRIWAEVWQAEGSHYSQNEQGVCRKHQETCQNRSSFMLQMCYGNYCPGTKTMTTVMAFTEEFTKTVLRQKGISLNNYNLTGKVLWEKTILST